MAKFVPFLPVVSLGGGGGVQTGYRGNLVLKRILFQVRPCCMYLF
jgi:hypothetical protein